MIHITLRQLEYLVTVADEGTIAGAADLCEVTPVAVGQALAELDRLLGTPLTTRRRAKGVELTEAGEIVAATARDIVRSVAHLPTAIADTLRESARHLRFGLFPSMSTWVAPELLDFMANRYPDTRVDFIEGNIDELQRALDSGEIIAYFTHRNQLGPGVQTFPLRHLRPYILVAEQHRLAQRSGIHFAELAEESFVLTDTTPAGQLVADILQSRGLGANIRWRSRNVETVKGIVGRGLAVALLYSFAEHRQTLAGEGLVNVPILDPVRANEAVVCLPEGLACPAFLNAIIEHFRALPVPPSIGESFLGLALDTAGGETGDNASLEGEHHKNKRHGH